MAKNPITINLAVEDELSEVVLRTLIKQSKKNFHIGHIFRRSGYGYLKKNLLAFNSASKGTPFLLLTDLDRGECAPSLIKGWCSHSLSQNFLFRVAVREVESWVLAHRSAFSEFFEIQEREVPTNTDLIADPKVFILKAAQKSRKRAIREAIVRISDGTLGIGPGYNSYLSQFVLRYWKAERAIQHSDSLLRTIKAIKKFKPHFQNS